MYPAVAAAQSVTLYTKLCEAEVILHKYFEGHNLLHIIEDGHVFLTNILQLFHPILSNTSILVDPIPCFTTSGSNLFQYVAHFVLHLEKHKPKKHYFSDDETTDFFLDYLDDEHFAVHKADCRTAMMLLSSVPLQYHLPTITATFAKLVPA